MVVQGYKIEFTPVELLAIQSALKPAKEAYKNAGMEASDLLVARSVLSAFNKIEAYLSEIVGEVVASEEFFDDLAKARAFAYSLGLSLKGDPLGN